MKALLMHRDRDFDSRKALPWNEQAVSQDLELSTLLQAMADGDEFLFDVARKALLSGLGDVDTIRYRQEILKDSLKNPAVVRGLYDLVVEAIESAKREWWGLSSRYPSSMLFGSVSLLETLTESLRKLRVIAEERHARFESAGFTALFAMVRRELSDDYLALVHDHLKELRFRKGVLLSAELGERNEGADYMLRHTLEKDSSWLRRILAKRPEAYTFSIADRDETGAQILADIHHRGITRVAVALAESAHHVLSFFKTLRTELAFYVGCMNLHRRLASKGEPMCFPDPAPAGERRHGFRGMYDVCLSLRLEGRAVGNAADADGRSLVIITGANQGGKSTFLRGVGLAQVMMQCGMFVGAESFAAGVCPAVITHYKREEDATMKSGKFDEELARMSEIVEHIAPDSLILFNESFAATNEREGSEIAGQIVRALLEKGMRIFYVTHMYEFAHACVGGKIASALFLRAERMPDGTRTFRLVEGEPLETSYGEDLYRQVFTAGTREVTPTSGEASGRG